MAWKRVVYGIGLFIALGGGAVNAQPNVPSPIQVWSGGQNCPTPGPLDMAPGTPGAMPSPLALGQAPEAGGDSPGTLVPNMFGDMSPSMIHSSSSPRSSPAGLLIARGDFKIAENESPRPQDRVFLTYNYYDDVYGSLNPSGTAKTDIHREVIGFEKTFLGGDASIGMRLPFLQVSGDNIVRQQDLGDLTIITKYAFINDRQTGNVLSGGLALTVPTGSSFAPPGTPNVDSVLFQPYLGGIYNMGDFYVHGFTALVIPTDSRDVTLWNNDFGVGWRVYQTSEPGRLVTFVVPTAELHVSTPLDHRGYATTPIPGIDIVDFTFGVTTGLGKRSTIGLAYVVPVTGPRPFTGEAQVQFNFNY